MAQPGSPVDAEAPYFSPVGSQVSFTGPIDGQRGLAILNAYSLAFFDMGVRRLNLEPFIRMSTLSCAVALLYNTPHTTPFDYCQPTHSLE
ncbi:MAG: hypothetical protein DYG89_24765 [Caldilinea sp. CFX5]|nr:hypothetical protein [Caldilinea sp. CFX5]